MKNILVIGAGRSASSMIKYLLDHSAKENWVVTVSDLSLEMVNRKTGNHPNARAIVLDINNEQQRREEIAKSDIVISMLPAFMHYHVAVDCVASKKHLVTASYVSKEIQELDAQASKAGIIFLNEMGLDPGIDHMSAMQIIDQVKKDGGEILSFKSYCGGLIAPESNDNPWGYKFTWNPRNVVLAGQGTAQYKEKGIYRFIPYNRLFTQTETITVDGYGDFDAYANRDSLSYQKPYGLENIPTILRGTLRMPGFCGAWNAFVKLGWTDDTYTIADSENITYSELLNAFLPAGNEPLKKRLASFVGESENSEVIQKLVWLGILENEKIKMKKASPAVILQDLLERKWKLKEQDVDMIVMQHQFEYITKAEGRKGSIVSSLVVKGEDSVHTAMAKTVGLPVAIAVKLILQGKIGLKGVVIPTVAEIYSPVLKELEMSGIIFKEKHT